MSDFHVTTRHCNIWSLRTTWALILTTICLWLQYAWILKKSLTLHGTLAFYINYLKLEFSSSLIKLISSFLSQKKIQSFSRRRNVRAKGNASRGASRFRPVSNIVKYVYKWYPPNTRCLSGRLCRWHLYVCHGSQRGLCSQTATARSVAIIS
jgi:hypothetical protein